MQNCASLTSLRTTSGEKKEAETHQKNEPILTRWQVVHASLLVIITNYEPFKRWISFRLTTKQVRASEDSVAQSFAESFGVSKKSKTAASEVSCSFEPFCKDEVVCWYKDKKEFFCEKHAQEDAQPIQKRSKKWSNLFSCINFSFSADKHNVCRLFYAWGVLPLGEFFFSKMQEVLYRPIRA